MAGNPLKIVVTGGGTGGHVSPALAVIEELQQAIPAPRLLYIGSVGGLERTMARDHDIRYVAIATGKLRRYFSLRTVTDALRVPLGVVQAVIHIGRFRPNVVFSTGGYVSVPAVVAAWLWRRPIVIHEQTATVGLANKINAFFATRIALTFEGAKSDLPAPTRRKAIVTGMPVRKAIFGGDPIRALDIYRLEPDVALPTIYVTGGAQGARIINRAIEEVLPDLLERCRIIHQCGVQSDSSEQDFDRLTARAAELPPELRQRYAVTRFVGSEINHVLALTDLVVGRAGAGTVAELCALGKPALFVPLVPTGGDEQTRNAQQLVDAGAAVIVPQREVSGIHLRDAILPLLADRARLRQMGRKAIPFYVPTATGDIAMIIQEIAINRSARSAPGRTLRSGSTGSPTRR